MVFDCMVVYHCAAVPSERSF